MKKLFLFIAISVSGLSATAQDFETPIHRSSMAYVEPHEWSTIDGEDDLVMIKGPNEEIKDYVVEFLDWCGVEYGKEKYYVINPNGQAWEISVVYGKQNIWVIVDLGKR